MRGSSKGSTMIKMHSTHSTLLFLPSVSPVKGGNEESELRAEPKG